MEPAHHPGPGHSLGGRAPGKVIPAPGGPGGEAGQLLSLQRTVGNQAVSQLLARQASIHRRIVGPGSDRDLWAREIAGKVSDESDERVKKIVHLLHSAARDFEVKGYADLVEAIRAGTYDNTVQSIVSQLGKKSLDELTLEQCKFKPASTGESEPSSPMSSTSSTSSTTSITSIAEPDKGGVPEKVTSGSQLFNILTKAAATAGLSVYEMEMRLAPPYSWVGSVPPNRNDMLDGNFKDLVKKFAEEKELTNSCGQTSDWLQLITAEKPTALAEGSEPAGEFIALLKKHSGKNWLCRIASGGHSFMLESFNGSMYIFQSWHGKQSLSTVLSEGPKKWAPEELLPMLEETLTPANKMVNTRKVFYGNLLMPSALVTFTMNEHPLGPDVVTQKILESLQVHNAAWSAAMQDATPVRQLQAKSSEADVTPEERERLLKEHEQEKEKGPAKQLPSAAKVERASTNLSNEIMQFRQANPKVEGLTWPTLKLFIDGRGRQSQYNDLTGAELEQVKQNLIEWMVLDEEPKTT